MLKTSIFIIMCTILVRLFTCVQASSKSTRGTHSGDDFCLFVLSTSDKLFFFSLCCIYVIVCAIFLSHTFYKGTHSHGVLGMRSYIQCPNTTSVPNDYHQRHWNIYSTCSRQTGEECVSGSSKIVLYKIAKTFMVTHMCPCKALCKVQIAICSYQTACPWALCLMW